MPLLVARAFLVAILLAAGVWGIYGELTMVADGHGDDATRHQHDVGQVLVTELPDTENVGRFSGLFVAHWEDEEGEQSVLGPQEVSIDEAIKWGRQQSGIVLVQIGGGRDGMYSAGTKPVRDVDTKPWPASGLVIANRPVGTPLAGEVQTVAWAVEVELLVSSDSLQSVFDMLGADARIAEVGELTLSDKTFEMVFDAGSGTEAVGMAWKVVAETVADYDPSKLGGELPLTVTLSGRR